MMNLFEQLTTDTQQAIQHQFNKKIDAGEISITPTKTDFKGNFTIVIFALLKHLKGNPVQIGEQIGEYLKTNSELVTDFNVVKGFLNLTISHHYWTTFLHDLQPDYWTLPKKDNTIVLEYCGPNTNKPLHLGHVRNMLVGWATAEILQRAGNQVHKVNIYNDRGIAISKSMVAWEEFGNGETPESTGIKGDHFVGKYYVKFAEEEARQAQPFMEKGMDKREAVKQTPIYQKAQQYLQKWEEGDEDVLRLWKKMNGWVYAGFQTTFEKLGVDFEKDYLESSTYLLGKKIVEEGLENGSFFIKEDGSVWVNLENAGLDEKILLRADGTSVYITQDLGTAQLRYEDYKMDESVYVVGNEQDYHFQVLKATLEKLNKPYANGIHHLSYGMVDLPEGKMKSREGTVVDADDIIAEMKQTASDHTEELGKIDHFTDKQKTELYSTLGLGALKFFILRVDPRKRMLFNPQESIEFQGFTGPFVQYTHARIQSLIDKAGFTSESAIPVDIELEKEEIETIILLHDYRETLKSAAEQRDPSVIAKYAYDLAKTFNQFYANVQVNNEEDEQKRTFRLHLVSKTGEAIQQSLSLLGIKAPNRM